MLVGVEVSNHCTVHQQKQSVNNILSIELWWHFPQSFYAKIELQFSILFLTTVANTEAISNRTTIYTVARPVTVTIAIVVGNFEGQKIWVLK